MKRILTLLLLSFPVPAIAQDPPRELFFGDSTAEKALVFSGTYSREGVSCVEIIIEGSVGNTKEAEYDPGTNAFGIAVEGLCTLNLINMDETRGMLVRFSEAMKGVALLNDERWTTSGAQLSPAGRRSFSLILSGRKPQKIPIKVQYEQSSKPPTNAVLILR